MNSDELLRYAFNLSDLAAKFVGFFVTLTVAVGAWLSSNEAFFATDEFSKIRIAWVLAYFFICAVLGFATLQAAIRVNACYEAILSNEEGSKTHASLSAALSRIKYWPIVFAFASAFVVFSVLTLRITAADLA